MATWIEWFRERRSNTQPHFKRGNLPNVALTSNLPVKHVILGGFFVGTVISVILWLILSYFKVEKAGEYAFRSFDFIVLGFWLLPFFMIIIPAIRFMKWPYWKVWRQYPKAERWVACGALAFLLVGISDQYVVPFIQDRLGLKYSRPYETTINIPGRHPKVIHYNGVRRAFSMKEFWIYYWPLTIIGLYAFMHWLSRQKQEKVKLSKVKETNLDSLPFRLWLGESTGWLSNLWHPANIAGRQQIGLSLEDAAQNILILGAIGSGKTTRAVHPLLIQLFDQDCGGLIFDIKGDFKAAVFQFSEMVGFSPTLIGVSEQPMNLLAGLTPEMAASFLKSALLLGGGVKLDSFWTDTATELCRNTLGILSFIPKHFHLNGLYRYLFEKPFQEEVDQQIDSLQLVPASQRRLEAYQNYLKTIFQNFDEKVKSGVLASVAQILSPFQHPDLVDTFCATSENAYRMEAVLEGTVYLVDMPLALWGMAGKVVYTLIKLRFFNVMQQRNLHNDWNQTRPVFFMCDEYQEIVSCNKEGLSDLNFWDKSRSSKTIGIISAQSISSFYAAIGDQNLSHALLQNFRQKLVFRVEDDWTISYCNRLLGKVETRQIVPSSSAGSSSGAHGNSHQSSGESISIQQREVIDGQLFRNIGADQVLALLSIRGYAADDVLNVAPVFV